MKHLVATFGPFVRLFINKTVVNEIQSNVTNANRTNAFDVMIEAQRQLSTITVPEAHKNPCNKKEELFNALIKFIETNEFKWTPSEMSANVGVNIISTLTDVLWYIDGHYEKFAERYCGIPAVFHQFTDYNKPETEREKYHHSQVIFYIPIHNDSFLINLVFGIIHNGNLLSKKWNCWLKGLKNTALLYNQNDNKL